MLEFIKIMLLFMAVTFLLSECFNIYRSLRAKITVPTFKYKKLIVILSISYLLTLLFG